MEEFSDYKIKEEAKRRGLFDKEFCKICGEEMLDVYDFGGTLDCTICPENNSTNTIYCKEDVI